MKKFFLLLALMLTVAGCAMAASSGSCGQNIKWTLDDNGNLIISSSGSGWIYSPNWDSAKVKNVTIGNDVFKIGNKAFSGCTNLISISIPESVTTIDYDAFENCSSLVSITLPDSITTINGSVFSGCSSLESIVIPDQVKSIGSGTFKKCISLNSIVIPGSVKSIGGSAFSDCSSLTSIIIPNGVTSIGSYVFSGCTNLNSVVLPESVVSIGYSAFRNCTNLSSISIPSGVTVIDNELFSGCTSLRELTIPNGVEKIGDRAFEACSSLTSIIIPDNVTSLGGSCFYNCTGLKSVVLPGGITRLGDYIFSYTGLTSIAIPDSVTEIGASAFYACKSLTEITLPDNVISIGDSAFSSCTNLISISLSEQLKTIGKQAFGFCSGLTYLHMPDNINIIGQYAFLNCPAIIYSNVESDCAKTLGKAGYSFIPYGSDYSVKYLFQDETITGLELIKVEKDIVSFSVPDYVTSIGNYVFSGCKDLVNISFINGVTDIGKNAFYGCDSLTNITFPNGLKSINESAFGSCSSLQTVGLPDGLVDIGKDAFSYCTSITSIIIPDSVSSIDDSAFRGIKPLLVIPHCNSYAYQWASAKKYGVEVQNHSEVVVDAEVAATCANTGLTKGSHCSSCGTVFVAQKTIPKKDHILTIDHYARAYCTTDGLTEGSHCIVCGEVIIPQEVIPATGHNKVVDEPGVEATCEYYGYSEQSHCSICSDIISSRSVIPPKGHIKVIDIPKKDPTCTDAGYTEQSHCSVCGVQLSIQKTLPAFGHTLVIDPYVAPTTSSSGLSEGSHCKVCNQIIKEQNILDPIPNYISLSDCVRTVFQRSYGFKLVKITDEGRQYSNAEYAAENYLPSIGIVVQNPTASIAFSSTESIKQMLLDNGFSITGDKTLYLLDNKESGILDIESGRYITNRCGNAVWGFKYTNDNGYLGIIALNVNHVLYSIYVTSERRYYSNADSCLMYIAASLEVRHAALFQTEAIAASCEHSGRTASVYCASCQESIRESKEIPRLEHGLIKTEKISPTCTSEGVEEFWECLLCKKKFSDGNAENEISTPTTIEASGHVWGAPTYYWSEDNSAVTATCYCENDSTHKQMQTAYTKAIVTQSPTCTESGEKSYTSVPFTCPLFEIQTKVEKYGTPTGHNWGNPEYSWASDNSSVTGTCKCKSNSKHILSETVSVHEEIISSATCLEAGISTYISSSFTNPEFSVQKKENEVVMPLGHEWGDPIYSWNDSKTEVNAAHICRRDESHKETETASVTHEKTKEASCTECSETTYSSADFINPAFSKQVLVIKNDDALGHDWAEPVYVWSNDNTWVKAEHVCKRDTGHIEDETVSTSSKVTKEATCTEKGETTYTSQEFKNRAFTEQTRRLDNIEQLGHDWDEPVYSWSTDNTKAMAHRVCRRNEDHIESETILAVASIQSPSIELPGKALYRAEFEGACFNDQEKVIIIPALKDLKVLQLPGALREIKDKAFEGILSQAVIIPDGCEKIEENAFANCANLLYIRIPKSITHIDENAFYGCKEVVLDYER